MGLNYNASIGKTASGRDSGISNTQRSTWLGDAGTGDCTATVGIGKGYGITTGTQVTNAAGDRITL